MKIAACTNDKSLTGLFVCLFFSHKKQFLKKFLLYGKNAQDQIICAKLV